MRASLVKAKPSATMRAPLPSTRQMKPSAHSGMPAWQDRLFIGLARSANDATDFFQIPTGRVVEVGTQVAV